MSMNCLLKLAPHCVWAALFLGLHTGQAAVPLALDPGAVHELTVTPLADNQYALKTTGADPYVLLKPLPVLSKQDENVVLEFEYFCPDGIEGLEIFYGPPISAAHAFDGGHLVKAEGWMKHAINLPLRSEGRWHPGYRQLRLDFGRKPGIELRMRNLRLRPLEAEERLAKEKMAAERQRKSDQARTVRDYLDKNFPATLTSVTVTSNRIEFQGQCGPGQGSELFLAERRPHQELWGAHLWVPVSTNALNPSGGRITTSVPRYDGTRDRITSHWFLVRAKAGGGFEPVSHGVYATDVSHAAKHALDRKTSESRKGLGGVSMRSVMPELVELGVRHVTVNLWITDLLRPEAGDGPDRFEYLGRKYRVNGNALGHHDALIEHCTKHGMIVSAIILVGFGSEKSLIHPEANRAGHYAMPNLVTEEGAALYEATLALLAERYAQPGDPHGRITNWILHNEVDYGWEWTNMGQQPLEIYLDTYIRSMRLTYYSARRFNPQARVFISLTHRWNTPADETWRTYPPRRMLELLARYSRVEGDFEWGVAYHPYTQSLFRSDPWNDTKTSYDFDTELITMKNIEVLEAYLRQPAMRYLGEQPRGILLSEQGFHTPDYGDASEKLQAAALVYTWHKIRPLKTVEAFHNHRWVDHPDEGGLKLGLRTLPAPDQPDGTRKLAWSIFQALEAENEPAATAFAQKIIGVQSFSDIPYRGVIGDGKSTDRERR